MYRKKRTRRSNISSPPKQYWTSLTEEAIIWFNKTDDEILRNHIWNTYLYKPFDKLAENIINRFKFFYLNQSFDDTKKQVISFLVTNLHKYNAAYGKSFSYFSVIAKNYLILHNNNSYREEKRSIYLSDFIEDSASNEETLILEAPDERINDDIQEFVRLLIEYWDVNVTLHFKKKRDRDIANSVIELFRRANSVENFNKKALYNNIKDLTAISTNNTPRAGNITRVIIRMKSIILKQFQNFNDHGTLDNI